MHLITTYTSSNKWHSQTPQSLPSCTIYTPNNNETIDCYTNHFTQKNKELKDFIFNVTSEELILMDGSIPQNWHIYPFSPGAAL